MLLQGRSLLCLALVGAFGCSGTSTSPRSAPFALAPGEYAWGEVDFVDAGWRTTSSSTRAPGYDAFFLGGALRDEFAEGVVRIETRVEVRPSAWTSDLGSGLVLRDDGGTKVLTARHVVGPGGRSGSVAVTDRTGTRANFAAPAGRPAPKDLVVLRADASRPTAEPETRSARVTPRSARRGEPVVVIGYPGGTMGVDTSGRVVSPPPHSGSALDPVAVMGRVVSARPLIVEPTAGFVPLGGMSGSPVLGADGAVLGVLASVQREGQDGDYRFVVLCEPLESSDLMEDR